MPSEGTKSFFRFCTPARNRSSVPGARKFFLSAPQRGAWRCVFPSAFVSVNQWLNGLLLVLVSPLPMACGLDHSCFSDYETKTASETVSETKISNDSTQMHGKTESGPVFHVKFFYPAHLRKTCPACPGVPWDQWLNGFAVAVPCGLPPGRCRL